jgi:HK97 gp10 family phage protein
MTMAVNQSVRVEADISGTLLQLDTLESGIRRKVVRTATVRGGQAATAELKANCPIRDTREAIKTSRVRERFGVTVARTGQREGIKVKGYRGGLLRKAMGYKVKVYRNSGVAVAICGARTGFRQEIGVVIRGPRAGQPVFADPVKYAHLANNGTKNSPPHDFMRPAAKTGANVTAAELSAGVDQAIAEGARA